MLPESPFAAQRRRLLMSALAAGIAAPAAGQALTGSNAAPAQDPIPSLQNEPIMKITFIHRPLKNDDAIPKVPPLEPRPIDPSVVGRPSYKLSIHDGIFEVDLHLQRYGRTYSGKARIPILPGIYVNLRYEEEADRIALVNLRHSGYENNKEKETETSFYFGRVLITTTGIYASLNGRHADIPGVENFARLPDESSETALKRCSPEARLLIEQIAERNRLLSHVDLLDYVLYLEAQVDFLTKIVLDQNLVKQSTCLELLKYADSQASYRYEKEPALKNLFTAKMQMRQAQQLARLDSEK